MRKKIKVITVSLREQVNKCPHEDIDILFESKQNRTYVRKCGKHMKHSFFQVAVAGVSLRDNYDNE